MPFFGVGSVLRRQYARTAVCNRLPNVSSFSKSLSFKCVRSVISKRPAQTQPLCCNAILAVKSTARFPPDNRFVHSAPAHHFGCCTATQIYRRLGFQPGFPARYLTVSHGIQTRHPRPDGPALREKRKVPFAGKIRPESCRPGWPRADGGGSSSWSCPASAPAVRRALSAVPAPVRRPPPAADRRSSVRCEN